MPKIELDAVPPTNATGYPAPFDAAVEGRWYRRLGPLAGLTDFAVSHVVLKPGAYSSQRHWHVGEDEFLIMLDGEAVLIDDEGEHRLVAGDCAAFPKNDGNGHHLLNRGSTDCVFVVVGGETAMGGEYSDIDMRFTADGRYLRKDGTPYDARRVR